jgi:hypothetical protein
MVSVPASASKYGVFSRKRSTVACAAGVAPRTTATATSATSSASPSSPTMRRVTGSSAYEYGDSPAARKVVARSGRRSAASDRAVRRCQSAQSTQSRRRPLHAAGSTRSTSASAAVSHSAMPSCSGRSHSEQNGPIASVRRSTS